MRSCNQRAKLFSLDGRFKWLIGYHHSWLPYLLNTHCRIIVNFLSLPAQKRLFSFFFFAMSHCSSLSQRIVSASVIPTSLSIFMSPSLSPLSDCLPVSSSLYSLLSLHHFFFLICHFPLSPFPGFFFSFLSVVLCQPVCLCLFPTLSLYFSFVFLLLLSDSLPAAPAGLF